MSKKSLVLVDSSVWIEGLRRNADSNLCKELDELIANDLVAICGPIKAEILSGASNSVEYRKLQEWFSGLHEVPIKHESIWDQVALLRYELAKKGLQHKVIDVLIAQIAVTNKLILWTLDKDFNDFVKIMPLVLFHRSF